jgi:hypothetical protein
MLNLPDSVIAGWEETLTDAYIHSDPEARNQINDILIKMKSVCINIVSLTFNKCKDPDVLKSIMELLSKKGDLARQWLLKILDDQNQPLSMLNIALLVIVNVGNGDDVNVVKKYVKHSNPSIRAKALSAIARLNKKDAESIVIEALNDEEEKVRNQAANLIERELSLSGESVNKILLFVKERLRKKNITLNQAVFIAGLIKATGRAADGLNKENAGNEIIGIASDLLKERTGLLKFIKTDPDKEQLEIISACLSTLGKTGGTKSRDYLKSLSRGDSPLSKIANEAMAELDKRPVLK